MVAGSLWFVFLRASLRLCRRGMQARTCCLFDVPVRTRAKADVERTVQESYPGDVGAP